MYVRVVYTGNKWNRLPSANGKLMKIQPKIQDSYSRSLSNCINVKVCRVFTYFVTKFLLAFALMESAVETLAS